MYQQLEDRQLLPVRQAFVVQFSAETAVGQQRFVGRAEHVVSGQAVHFTTLDALLTFMVQVLHELADMAAPPPFQKGDER